MRKAAIPAEEQNMLTIMEIRREDSRCGPEDRGDLHL